MSDTYLPGDTRQRIQDLIKNRKIITPALTNKTIKDAMKHPASLLEIMTFKRYKMANLAFYVLGVLPGWLTVFIITVIATKSNWKGEKMEEEKKTNLLIKL